MASNTKRAFDPLHLEKTFSESWKLISNIPFEAQVPCSRVIPFEHKAPDWVFDFVFWEHHAVVEINGGTHLGRNGGHSSGAGIKKGYFKNICVQSQGWLFFELDSLMCKDLLLLQMLHDIMVKIPAGASVYPNPTGMVSYGSNYSISGRLGTAERTILNWLAYAPEPKAGDFCFDSQDVLKYLTPFKKGRSRLCITQIRAALLNLGFAKGRRKLKDKYRTAYFHTDATVELKHINKASM